MVTSNQTKPETALACSDLRNLQQSLTATHLQSTAVTESGVNSDSHTSLVYGGHRIWQWTLTATHLWSMEVTESGSELWQPHIFGLQRSQNLAVNSDSHTSLVYRGHRIWQWTLTVTHLWSTEVTESGSELWQPHIFGLQRSQNLAVNSDSHTSSVYRGHRIWQWTLMVTYLQSTEVTETCSKIWQPHVFGQRTCSKFFGLESQKLELNNILVQVHRDQEILINLSSSFFFFFQQ